MSRNRVQQSRSALSWRSTARGLLAGAALVLAVGGLVGPVGSASAATASSTDVTCPVSSTSSTSTSTSTSALFACSPVRTSLGVRWQ
jgi:hypothetical protein